MKKSEKCNKDKTIKACTREQFLEQANAEYALFIQDKAAHMQEQQELAEWDSTLHDGLAT